MTPSDRSQGATDTAADPDEPAVADDRPEADVVEQSRLVDEEQFVDRSTGHDRLNETVNEADWLEQSLGENLDDDRR